MKVYVENEIERRIIAMWHENPKLREKYGTLERFTLAILDSALEDWEESYHP